MKIITYSDLHLELGTAFRPPADSDADLMILAGDIMTFADCEPLKCFLEGWDKPLLYVAGNHEYYRSEPISAANKAFKSWLAEINPTAVFLDDESVEIEGVHFFGGTMWTNFAGADVSAMRFAERQISDYRCIRTSGGKQLKPHDTVDFHDAFVERLQHWFEQDLSGSRVVITHHAPVMHPHTRHGNSRLVPVFNSLDMVEIIEAHQPDLWVYGHTHECDDQMVKRTRIISNQLGYPTPDDGFECHGFDPAGLPIEVH